jgi:tight adherence protein B
MYSLILLAVVLAGGLLALRGAQASRTRRLALERIGAQILEDGAAGGIPRVEEAALPVYPRRYRWAPLAAGLAVGPLIVWLTGLPIAYGFGFGFLGAAIAYLLEERRADMQIQRIEAQLADALDMMVASLRAGTALLAALEATLTESRQPMRGELENLVGRIRLGEDPRAAVRELAMRVPLESFRLFSYCLLVHWETGGSLAVSLRTVASTVRDRIEVARRIAAQAVESQVSVVAVMGITYGLVLLMYHTSPLTYRKLLFSLIGSYIACGLMFMQGLGIIWIWRMSRIRF